LAENLLIVAVILGAAFFEEGAVTSVEGLFFFV